MGRGWPGPSAAWAGPEIPRGVVRASHALGYLATFSRALQSQPKWFSTYLYPCPHKLNGFTAQLPKQTHQDMLNKKMEKIACLPGGGPAASRIPGGVHKWLHLAKKRSQLSSTSKKKSRKAFHFIRVLFKVSSICTPIY